MNPSFVITATVVAATVPVHRFRAEQGKLCRIAIRDDRVWEVYDVLAIGTPPGTTRVAGLPSPPDSGGGRHSATGAEEHPNTCKP